MLCFDSCHTSACCRSDRLSVFLVCYIAGREDSFDIGCGVNGSEFRDDISILIGSDLSFEEVRIRFVADSIEESSAFYNGFFISLIVDYFQSC